MDGPADVIEEMRLACVASLEVLNELLSYEKLESGLMRLERTLIPVWCLVKQSLHPLANMAKMCGIRLKFRRGQGGREVSSSDLQCLLVRVDATKVSLALKSLITNAIKHTPRGGSVSLTVQRVEHDRSNISGTGSRSTRGTGMIRILVTDTGIGMTQETQSRLFKEESGLGLWLAKTIVELHNGSVAGMSKGMNEGSVFCVDLPLDSVKETKISGNMPVPVHSTRSSDLVQESCHISTSSARQKPLRIEVSSLVVSPLSLSRAKPSLAAVHSSTSGRPLYPEVTSEQEMCQMTASEVCTTGLCSPYSPQEDMVVEISDTISTDISPSPPLPLPLSSARRTHGLQSKEEEEGGGGGVPEEKESDSVSRVLIVDDASLNRRMLRRILQHSYPSIDEAVDGSDAIEMYRVSAAEGNPYAVILMDFQMPNMDGPEATHLIRQMGFRGPIIGVTGNALPFDMQLFLSRGADEILLKPVSIDTLETAITRLLYKETET